VTPVESVSTLVMLRRASGSARTSVAPIDSFWAADAVSTSGAVATTATVSDSWPTSIVNVCCTVRPAPRSSPWLENVLKPCSSMVRV
jgi:hypothetical protein